MASLTETQNCKTDPATFSDPAQMLIELQRRAKQRGWGIAGQQIEVLEETRPRPTCAEPLVALSFRICLAGGFAHTMKELWMWVQDTNPGSACGSALAWYDSELRPLGNGCGANVPCVEWSAVDLGANYFDRARVDPFAVRHPSQSAGLEVFTALALHTAYTSSIGGSSPALWVAGVEARMPGDEPDSWLRIPRLRSSADGCGVSLTIGWPYYHLAGYAVPELVALETVK